MKSKTIGECYKFTYPCYGTPNSFLDYTAHSGQRVVVQRKLKIPKESCCSMYEIKAPDGWVGHAFPEELQEVKERAGQEST